MQYVASITSDRRSGQPHDTKPLEATLQAIVIDRPEPTDENPQHLCLNKDYDNPTGHTRRKPPTTPSTFDRSENRRSLPRSGPARPDVRLCRRLSPG